MGAQLLLYTSMLVVMVCFKCGVSQMLSVSSITSLSEGAGSFTIEVTSDVAVSGDHVITLEAQNIGNPSTAAPNHDYQGDGTYSVTILDGETSGQLVVNIIDDLLAEPSESVELMATSTTGGTITATDTATFMINDNGDTEKVQINFAEWEFRFTEPSAQSPEALPIVFTIGNSKNSPRVPLNGAVDVSLLFPKAATNDTAVSGTDYTATTVVTLTLDQVTTSNDAVIDILPDVIDESIKVAYVTLSLSDDTYAELGSYIPTARILFEDDDDGTDYIAVNSAPVLGRTANTPIYIYSVTNVAATASTFSFQHDQTVPSSTINLQVGSTDIGKRFMISRPGTNNGNRFGDYSIMSSATEVTKVFVKRDSSIIRYLSSSNYRYTFTAYPREAPNQAKLDEALTIGVTISNNRFANNIKWRKDGVLKSSWTSRTRTFRDVTDAGVYEVSRGQRGGKKSWFAIFEIIVSSCARGKYGSGCASTCPTCINGGVCDPDSGKCICPPCFMGETCELVDYTHGGLGQSRRIYSSALTGVTGTSFKGHMFCQGGTYGCTCGCGWTEEDCEKPCPTGKFGPNCSLDCNCVDSLCNRFTGICDNGCQSGSNGDNCQE